MRVCRTEHDLRARIKEGSSRAMKTYGQTFPNRGELGEGVDSREGMESQESAIRRNFGKVQ